MNLSTWLAPDASFRGKPFWCWNHKLEHDELLRQLTVFKDMGMGGAIMHSRTGLKTEYLGDEWFELINACADRAEQLGLEAWLYDEDRWPSGSAGGKATRDERFRMKYLRLTIVPPGQPASWPDEQHFLDSFSADVEGLRLGAYTRIAYGATPAPGQSLLLFSWELMAPHSFYNGAAYLDTLDRAATEHFLHLTHDQYAARCGARLGRSIKGIFTDEPHRGFVMCDSHGQPGPVNTSWITPWTPALWNAFSAAFGYDLRERLPELFLCKDGARLSRVKWEYMELVQRMFLENWARPLHQRCQQLGLLLTGHVLHEDSLGAQAVPCGSVMRYYPYMDVPGVDVLGLDNRNYWVVKQLASVARQLGQPWLLSELYGCSGWQTTFTDHKRIGDWQALFGINVRCHHLCWYSMAGEAKRDYPASIFFQSAWYREYADVETYFSRLHVLLQSGRPACDVLVINPVESVWAQIHPGWATWLTGVAPAVQQLEAIQREVFHWLAEAHIDFDYGDEAHLAERAVVDADGHLRLGQMAYRTVIVCGMETMRAATLALLQQLRDAGGTVIFAGEPPTHLDAQPSELPRHTAAACVAVPRERDALVRAVRAAGGAADAWRVEATGAALFSQVRHDETYTIAVLINPLPDQSAPRVTLRAKARGAVRELDCLRGTIYDVPCREEEGWLVWETAFAPLQERAFLFGENLPDATARAALSVTTTPQPLSGPFTYELDEPNMCVLDYAEWRAGDDTAWNARAEVLQIEELIAAQYGIPVRSGDMVQPWAAPADSGPRIPLTLRFTFSVEVLPASDILLMLEQPEQQRITVNGHPLPVPRDTGWFIDPCFRTIPLPASLLRAGVNEILLEREYGYGSDLEAIYLLGSFGVSVSGPHATLTRLPDALHIGSVTAQGLPFYSGHIRYHIKAGTRGRLELPGLAAACVTFRSPNGRAAHAAPWAPFACQLDQLASPDGVVIADVALTRRNTFGPLHLVPIDQPGIGPHSFRSRGAQWSDEYQLIPAGLTTAPRVYA